MALQDMGRQISSALSQMCRKATVDESALEAMLKDVTRALLSADVEVKLVQTLRESVRNALTLQGVFDRKKVVEQAVCDALVNMLDAGVEPYLPRARKVNIVMMVGLQGAGKTTTCAKLAMHYKKKKFRVGVVCADTFRAGAHDQLRQNAAKVKVSFHGSLTESDPVAVAVEGVNALKAEGCNLIIVDTSGRHKQDEALLEEMELVEEAVKPDEVIFVMDSTIGQAARGHATAFRERVKVGSVILTKLDGHARGGGALSAVAATKSPLIFLGTGEAFDELQPFEARRFVRKILGMGDIEGLKDMMQQSGLDKDSRAMRDVQRGVLTMRDMRDHFANLMKMGPVDRIVVTPQGNPNANMKIFLVLIDSMTDFELDHPDVKQIMTRSRAQRIWIGSGKGPREMQALMEAHWRMKELVAAMPKINAKELARNPGAARRGAQQQGLSQVARAMDPAMLRQLGGMDGVARLVKQIEQVDEQMDGPGGRGGKGRGQGRRGGR